MSANQLSLFDVLAEQDQVAWASANTKTYDALMPGDYVEERDERGTVLAGWCVARHPVDGAWEVETADTGWQLGSGGRFFALGGWKHEWRFVRHDAAWTRTPTLDALIAWMRETGATLPQDRFHEVYHAAMDAWPRGAWTDAQRATVAETFTDMAIAQFPVAEYLRTTRRNSGAGKHIWSCPLRIQQAVTDRIWPLPGPERLTGLLALRWTRAEQFDGSCPAPEGILAFNRNAVSIYEGYLRWAIAHAEGPRQLLELCDEWGSNPAPEWLKENHKEDYVTDEARRV